MSFLLYDLIFLVLFCLFVFYFLYKRKENLKREGIIYLYRTKVGIKFINYVGEKFKRFLGVLQYVCIALAYVLMVGIFYILIKSVYTYLAFPEVTEVIKAPPLVPLIPYFPEIFGVQSFFPPFYFTYFIIAVLIVATVHEFSHGIFAKAKGLKIKSTGFAFLGPLIGAFVEPDEKQMEKKSKIAQMGIISAGVFANVITTIIFILLAWLFLFLAFTEGGFIFSGYMLGIVNVSSVNSIGNHSLTISNANAEEILELIEMGELKESFSIPLGSETISMIEIKADDRTYFISQEDLKAQLNVTEEVFVAFPDFPAIRSGLKGTIIELNGEKIKNQETLSRELAKHKPGDKITIKTNFEEEVLSYNLQLAESPTDKNKAFLGVSSQNYNNHGLRGMLYKFFNFFESSSTALKPKVAGDLMFFIKDLLWWIIIINALVALFNMLPAGFLDGGRFFYLTMLAIVKKEKTAKKISRIMVYLIFLILISIMIAWFIALF